MISTRLNIQADELAEVGKIFSDRNSLIYAAPVDFGDI